MLQYAIKKSFEEMQSVIKLAETDLNNDELKKEVNYRVGTFLHWLLDYYEWLEKTYEKKLDKNDISFFSGLRYANNKLKHDPTVIQIYERTGGFSFPITFPLSIEKIEFKWGKIDVEKNPKRQNQYNNYITYIEGKEIIIVSQKALKRLDNYKQNIRTAAKQLLFLFAKIKDWRTT